jgi:hypothetical protein
LEYQEMEYEKHYLSMKGTGKITAATATIGEDFSAAEADFVEAVADFAEVVAASTVDFAGADKAFIEVAT